MGQRLDVLLDNLKRSPAESAEMKSKGLTAFLPLTGCFPDLSGDVSPGTLTQWVDLL